MTLQLWSYSPERDRTPAVFARFAILKTAEMANLNAGRPENNRMSTICLHVGRLEEARSANEQALRSNPKTRNSNLESSHRMSGNLYDGREGAGSVVPRAPRQPVCGHEVGAGGGSSAPVETLCRSK